MVRDANARVLNDVLVPALVLIIVLGTLEAYDPLVVGQILAHLGLRRILPDRVAVAASVPEVWDEDDHHPTLRPWLGGINQVTVAVIGCRHDRHHPKEPLEPPPLPSLLPMQSRPLVPRLTEKCGPTRSAASFRFTRIPFPKNSLRGKLSNS